MHHAVPKLVPFALPPRPLRFAVWLRLVLLSLGLHLISCSATVTAVRTSLSPLPFSLPTFIAHRTNTSHANLDSPGLRARRLHHPERLRSTTLAPPAVLRNAGERARDGSISCVRLPPSLEMSRLIGLRVGLVLRTPFPKAAVLVGLLGTVVRTGLLLEGFAADKAGEFVNACVPQSPKVTWHVVQADHNWMRRLAAPFDPPPPRPPQTPP